MMNDSLISGIPNLVFIIGGVLIVAIVIIIIIVSSKKKNKNKKDDVSILDVGNNGVPNESEKEEFSYGYEKQPTVVMDPVDPNSNVNQNTENKPEENTEPVNVEIPDIPVEEDNNAISKETLNADIPAPNTDNQNIVNNDINVNETENNNQTLLQPDLQVNNSASNSVSPTATTENNINEVPVTKEESVNTVEPQNVDNSLNNTENTPVNDTLTSETSNTLPLENNNQNTTLENSDDDFESVN